MGNSFAVVRTAVLVGVALVGGQAAGQENGRIEAQFEQYFKSDRAHKGAVAAMSYARVQAEPAQRLRIVGSYVAQPGWNWLDDEFVELESASAAIRVGRFRSDFGFSNWSEIYYTPFIQPPIIRSYGIDIVPGIPLNRLDRGVEVEDSIGPLQYQISIVDSSENDWQILPRQLDTGVARFQFALGNIMIGFNGLAKMADNLGPAAQAVGADFRWTAPRTQLRAEVLKGAGSSAATGCYADLYYRPPHLSRTQIGLRIECIDIPTANQNWLADDSYEGGWTPPKQNRERGTVFRVALRQFLTRYFALSVNYGAGASIPQSRDLLGWSGQLLFTVRF